MAASYSATDGSGRANSLVTVTKGFLAQPFNPNMNVVGWVLFTGLIIVVAFLWTRALRHMIPADIPV